MIVYLAHPVGQDPEQRALNLANVQEWFLWLIHNAPQEWTINVPWFIYVSNLNESYRERALRDDLRVLNTCDAIVLTGGRMSGGMQTELGLAIAKGLKVYDLTSLGFNVPGTQDSQSTQQMALDMVKQ